MQKEKDDREKNDEMRRKMFMPQNDTDFRGLWNVHAICIFKNLLKIIVYISYTLKVKMTMKGRKTQ